VHLTYLIGSVALGIILFDGGMRTHMSSVRVGIDPGIALATVGVAVTAASSRSSRCGSSTSRSCRAAPGRDRRLHGRRRVFSVLSARGLAIKRRVGALLEIESGCNDPMAVFLTIVLVQAIATGETSLNWGMAGRLVADSPSAVPRA
jgi:cell volume regulation protein A